MARQWSANGPPMVSLGFGFGFGSFIKNIKEGAHGKKRRCACAFSLRWGLNGISQFA
jgi:hypothetical protein